TLAGLAALAGTVESDVADDSESSTRPVATINHYVYPEEKASQYEQDHPGITVKLTTADTSEAARTNLTTKIAAGGEGLADIEAIEVDWLPELMQYPDLFEDLSDPELDGRWLDWKVDQATTPDGRLMGYGTDIGPEAICYRQDLFADAGLPTDPDEVAELLGGDDATWETYFDV